MYAILCSILRPLKYKSSVIYMAYRFTHIQTDSLQQRAVEGYLAVLDFKRPRAHNEETAHAFAKGSRLDLCMNMANLYCISTFDQSGVIYNMVMFIFM